MTNMKRKQESIIYVNSFDELYAYNKDISSINIQTRSTILLWRRPLITLNYFFKEVYLLMRQNYIRFYFNRRFHNCTFASVFLLVFAFIVFNFDGPHQLILKYIFWCFYWMLLGILSSIGLGTGLHTFILYLAPHIATVTIAAYECRSLNFPEPPYPENVLCPETSHFEVNMISIWSILRKVHFESFCWGAGTALGELPPYFLARMARLSSENRCDVDSNFCFGEKLNQINYKNGSYSLVDRAKYFVELFVKKIGFFGIMAFASIPNPLFDLAGITCGHFLVPFWKFFCATLIGKAVFKVTLQVIFVIILFSEKLLKTLTDFLEMLPLYGAFLKKVAEISISDQKQKFHRNANNYEGITENVSILSLLFEIITLAMIIYFVASIINSFAQAYYDRCHGTLKSLKV